ncbi:MAG: hypothetical protein LBE85_13765 [Candidatus Accumulibacter sp.]|nr:hypothetical protein [Accumulibacter sp.]
MPPPWTATPRDFGAAGKVSDTLPRRLAEAGAPASDAGAVGGIACYAPWGNIAFYRGAGRFRKREFIRQNILMTFAVCCAIIVKKPTPV